jgi:hypothetical protein
MAIMKPKYIEAFVEKAFRSGGLGRPSDAVGLRFLLRGGLAALTACSSSPSSMSSAGAGNDAAAAFAFQPSNIRLMDVMQAAPQAQDENLTGSCPIVTDTVAPEASCFLSPIEVVTQPDGSTVNLIVANSITLASDGSIAISGTVPLVLVSLSNVTISGSIDAGSRELNVGPGGAGPALSNAAGLGTGGGAAASGSAAIGGAGGSYCGLGGLGGGQTASGTAYGNAAMRPLVGGSAGGGGAVGSGAGGGAVQISAAEAINMNTASSITVGGQGGPIGGLAANQNAGGGGSGGSILLEAPIVTVLGTLAANGGGGGGDYSGAGGDNATASATPALGGAGGADDAAGGNGAASTATNGAPGKTGATLNSGGGGGAAGRIRINSTNGMATLSGVLSPGATTSCVSQGSLRSAADGP